MAQAGTDQEEREPTFGATGGIWRSVLLFVPLTVALLAGAALIGLVAGFSTRFREGGYLVWVRRWGRWPLRAMGIRVEVHGLERRDAPGPKLILFNHLSLLDLFVLSSLSPERPLVLYKRELDSVPGLGGALRAMGMIPVDRQDHAAAIASVSEATERILSEQAAVLMAPEGTRSRRGGLQRFKLGAFHLAANAQVPIVPMVIRGIDSVLPMNRHFARSGVIRVDFLPAISTRGWRAEDARRHATEVRDVFLRFVPPEPPLGPSED
jgi:putative phosphoserine phosphatase/1-acylglycerol-3-phosphate O-acyltransferase